MSDLEIGGIGGGGAVATYLLFKLPHGIVIYNNHKKPSQCEGFLYRDRFTSCNVLIIA